MKDEPTTKNPVMRELEQEAIRCYREKYPDGPPWQELDASTRTMWVGYVETKVRAPAAKGGA